MTDTTPKVCPFCSNVPPKTIHETRFGEGYLQCACCEARGPTSFADALTAWNTRANADARLVEALRDCVALLERIYPNPAPNGQINRARAALSEVSHG